MKAMLSRAYLQRIVSPHFALNRTLARRSPTATLPAPTTYAPATGLSMFGLLDYRGRRHGRLHSPRAARMAEKSPSTPIASSVQTKKKCPLVLASLLAPPTPFPLM